MTILSFPFELLRLTGNGLVDPADLTHAVALKAEFRKRTMTDAKDIFLRKEARLKKLWSVRLSAQMAELPEFDEVYRAVTRTKVLRPPGRQGCLLE